MVAGSKFDASSGIEKIRNPVLILHGNDDRVVPVSNAESLSEKLPDVKLRVFEGAGHLVFVESADEVNEEILSFLQKRSYPALDKLSAALRDRLRRLQKIGWTPVTSGSPTERKKKKSKTGSHPKSGLLASMRDKLTRRR